MTPETRRFRIIVLALLSLILTDRAFGTSITGPASHVTALNATDSDDLVILNPDPIAYLPGATQSLMNVLAADFPAWTFTYAPGLNGNLNVTNYEATTKHDDNGGALLRATYTRAATDPAIADLHWIQLIMTNFPFGDGDAESYLDNRISATTRERPFYSYEELNGHKTPSTFSFFDNPDRDDRTDPDLIRWRGELILSSWDGNTPGHVTVYDGIRWGWDLYDFAVPEPSTLGCFVFGSALLIAFRCARVR